MALERAQIRVLRRRARPHAALAQIDLLETLTRGSRVEIEQRALRESEPDGAVNVALHQFVAAFEAFVEAFEHAARLLAGLARAFQRDVIAARGGGGAEPPFDEREILAVLAEQRGGEAIVVESQNDLRRTARRGDERLGDGSDGIDRTGRAHSGSCGGEGWLVPCASKPNRLLVATSVMVTSAISPISECGASICTGWR